MGYCMCFICGKMTSMYEKYCLSCEEKYNLRQGDWRTFKPKTDYGTPERQTEISKEIEKDRLKHKIVNRAKGLKTTRKRRKERKRRIGELVAKTKQRAG